MSNTTEKGEVSLKGLEATQDSAFTHLLSPFALRDVALRNRTVFQPHFTALGDLNGMPTDDLVASHGELWVKSHHRACVNSRTASVSEVRGPSPIA